MGLISEENRKIILKEFGEHLKDPVELKVYVDDDENCQYCAPTVEIVSELSSLDSRISLKVIKKGEAQAEEGGDVPTKFPTVIVSDGKKLGSRVRYSGIPSGYEFSSLFEDIKTVSSGNIQVPDSVREKIVSIDKPVDIKVYVTPTCPYCPRAVGTAHRFAMLNSNITGEMIEATEFPKEASEAGVSSVPHIVINDDASFVGARPDADFAEFILDAIK
ncbi:MAG: thioredoxin family protein [Candidatus Thermoplasmatota archaeon]|jgi:glutaredoxin-like protein|nr:thioredoxin family protein [Candidatus Thermoplasmatota archaeon]MCL5799912.1 thioredoxin family protein [Candidatus Thermoplasmatota archaeon]